MIFCSSPDLSLSLTHTIVVSPLPHTLHTMHTPETHTTLSHHPRRQVLCRHLQTCPPTHFHTYIYTDPVQNHRDTYRCRQDAHRQPGTHWLCMHMHVYAHLDVLCFLCKFSESPLSGQWERGVNREKVTLLSCTAS